VLADLPSLGVGLGFRQPFKSDLFLNRQQVDFLEIVAEHYLKPSWQQQQQLELLASHFPLIPHAINLSLGSAEGVDIDYVRQLAVLIKQLNPPWWSEHICFTKAGGVDIGHLSPLPYTKDAVKVLCRNIAEVRRWIDVPLILENITYMDDVVARAAIKGIVLERDENLPAFAELISELQQARQIGRRYGRWG
jgi:uncharacterized protein (UPF0276 family)